MATEPIGDRGEAKVARRRTRGKGEGTITRRSDGRWAAAIDLGWINGRRRRKFFYAKTRAEVATRLIDEVAARNNGGVTPIGRRTVAQQMRAWIESIRPPSVRPRTWQSYETLSRVHIEPEVGQIQLTKLTHEAIQSLLNKKLRAGKLRAGLSVVTVKHIRTILRQALAEAVKNRLVAINAALLTNRLPKSSKPKIMPLDAEQTRRLLAAAKGTRIETIVLVGVRCGLRRGEILGLVWSDVDFAKRTLDIKRQIQRVKGQPLGFGPLKTQESERNIPLPNDVAAALEAHRIAQAKLRLKLGADWKGDLNLVFPNTIGRPFEPRLVHTKFKKILKRANMPDMPDLPATTRIHDLRHGTITTLLEADADVFSVSRLAGHKSIKTTLDMYGHWTEKMKKRLADKMNASAPDGSA
jgi:integrase